MTSACGNARIQDTCFASALERRIPGSLVLQPTPVDLTRKQKFLQSKKGMTPMKEFILDFVFDWVGLECLLGLIILIIFFFYSEIKSLFSSENKVKSSNPMGDLDFYNLKIDKRKK